MAKIRLFLHGQLLSEVELQSGQDIIAGRGSACEIRLPHEKGISRQHLKFYQDGEDWRVESLSRFGGLVFDGQSVDAIELKGDTKFSLPPFDFEYSVLNEAAAEFSEEEVAPVASAPETDSEAQENPERSDELDEDIHQGQEVNGQDSNTSTGEEVVSDSDTTHGGGGPELIAYLKIYNSKTHLNEVLKLEGNFWTAGRQPDLEIVIDDSAISRKHFEISKTKEGFFITDLDSSNGTILNGSILPPNEACTIDSGDKIEVRHLSITFEVHNAKFKDEVEKMPQLPALANAHTGALQEYLPESQGPAVIKLSDSSNSKFDFLKDPEKRKKAIRFGAGGLIAFILVFQVFFGGEKGQMDQSSQIETKELTEEEKIRVRDMYNLAGHHYDRGKFELCLDQLRKLHQIVPFYEDSVNLSRYCEQGISRNHALQDLQRKEEERRQVERTISSNVAKCKEQLDNSTTIEQMRRCLQPSLELDPQNPSAMDLILEIETRQKEEQARAQRAAAARRQRTNCQNQYNRARSLHQQGQLRQAQAQYRRFLNQNCAALNSEVSQARRSIASIDNQISEKVQGLLNICEQEAQKENWSDAINACDEALKEDPNNSMAEKQKKQAIDRMNFKMKGLWEDSILEESLGNIEAAKENWQKIISSSTTGSIYNERARTRLRRYGELP